MLSPIANSKEHSAVFMPLLQYLNEELWRSNRLHACLCMTYAHTDFYDGNRFLPVLENGKKGECFPRLRIESRRPVSCEGFDMQLY